MSLDRLKVERGQPVRAAQVHVLPVAAARTPAAWQWLFKRSFDVAAAVLLLLGLAPGLLLVAFLIWREDGGPVVFRQQRVGRDGRSFCFLKFRTMVRTADADLQRWRRDDPVLYARYVSNNFKLADDPRVLRCGRFLRRSSIDELPQLLNVLRGDMSLVGPRPLLARELGDYSPDALRLYHAVRPGITGLWQVSGRSTTSFRERASLDARYVREWSLRGDLLILFKTCKVVWRGDGAC